MIFCFIPLNLGKFENQGLDFYTAVVKTTEQIR